MSTSVTDFASLNAAIDAADAATSGDIVITLTNDITETATLDAINLHTGVTLTIDGGGHALDGAGQYRGLFAYAGTLTVSNLSIDNTVARGGDGGNEGAGGGAGLGGGLFIAGTDAGLASGADVTLENVAFRYARAAGGAGGSSTGQFNGNVGPIGTYGGGGGLGGNGGGYALAGGGGGGIGGYGGADSAGQPGLIEGAAGGGNGATPAGGPAPFPGGANGGGGGSPAYATFSGGGGGGVGGAPGFNDSAGRSYGGNGGFGGGGGGAGQQGGNGGFGGGGGSSGGNGGFGGGAGAISQLPGFGGGAGSTGDSYGRLFPFLDGGGGLGAGGAVFIQQGGTLTISGGRIAGGSAMAGIGGAAPDEAPSSVRNGQALGSGIFLQGDQTLVFSEAAGQTTTIRDVIADQTGSGGTGADAGAGKLSIEGPGALILAHKNTYSGGTTVASGALELAAAGAAGSGAISLRAPDATSQAGGTLQLDAAALPGGVFANPIFGFSKGTLIDLAGFAGSAGTSAVVNGNTLTVSDNGITNQLTLGDYDTMGPVVLATFSDGHGGTIISPAQQLATDVISLKVSEDAYQGDAQYTVSLDGKMIGGIRTATASHSAGASQDVSISGNFGPGAHTIGITFLNDAYGGSPATDRNLYVDAVSFDGRAAVPPSAAFYSAGAKTFNIPPASSASTLTLLLAEDAYQGDAQYAIAIDGKPGLSGTVTASNAAGQAQVVDLSQILPSGNHDIAISFLNDAYGGSTDTDRNLYVKGAELNGVPLPGASVTLYSSGTQHISFATT